MPPPITCASSTYGEVALDFALDVLAPDGTFIAKVFKGGTERDLLDLLKRSFGRCATPSRRPAAPNSAETYVVATGFRGQQNSATDQ